MATTSDDSTGFCPDCGSILPPINQFPKSGTIECYSCGRGQKLAVFGDMYLEYDVLFNKLPDKNQDTLEKEEESNLGPVIERKCVKCGNDKMSYACLQLRSADEGQTVFFTCTKCNYKESENS